MLDAKEIENLATTLRQQTEQLRVAEVAHNLADRFFVTAGKEASEDFRWRVIATMVGEVALREAGLTESIAGNRADGTSQQSKKWRWWL